MSIILHKDIPFEFLHVPRNDLFSLTVKDSPLLPLGSTQVGTINDANLVPEGVVFWREELFFGDLVQFLADTGVTNAEIQVINGVIPGTVLPDKVLVVDSNRDLAEISGPSRIRDLFIERDFDAIGDIIGENLFSNKDVTVGENLTVTDDMQVLGHVIADLVLDASANVKLMGFFLGSPRPTIAVTAGFNGSGIAVRVGAINSNCVLSARNSNDFLIDYTGTSLEFIWHTGNDGPGSGLDADTLDGIEAADLTLLSAFTPVETSMAEKNAQWPGLSGAFNTKFNADVNNWTGVIGTGAYNRHLLGTRTQVMSINLVGTSLDGPANFLKVTLTGITISRRTNALGWVTEGGS